MRINLKQLLLTFVTLLFINTSYSKDPEIHNSIKSLKKELSKSVSDTKRVDLLNELSRLEMRESECQAALKYAREAEKLASKIKYTDGLTGAYVSLTAAYRSCGEYERSINYSKKSLTRLKATKNIAEEAFIYYQLGDLYFAKKDTIKSRNYLNKSLTLSEKSKDLLLQAQVNDFIAEIYYNRSDFTIAINHYKASLECYKKINKTYRIALASGNVALANYWSGNTQEALSYSIFSLKKYEEAGNEDGIVWMNSFIGMIYKSIKEYDKSLEYMNKVLKIQKKGKNSIEKGNTYLLLSKIYFEMNNFSKSRDFVSKAEVIYNELDYSVGLQETTYWMGVNYFKEKKYGLALLYLQRELDDAKTRVDLYSVAHCKRFIGAISVEEGNIEEGKKLLNESLEYLKKTLSVNHSAFVYKYLVKADSISGDFESAFEHYKSYIECKSESVNTQKDTEKIAIRYEFEKKEAVAKSELKTKNIQRNAAVIGLILMTIIVLIVVFLFQLRNKKMKVEKENMELSKREVDRIVETEQFKSRFLANISHEFRTPLTLINGHLEVLKENGRKEDFSHFDEMEQNGKRLLNLINQLLDLSKMESGQYKLQYKKGNVLNETSMLVQSFYSYAEQHGISLTVKQIESAKVLAENPFVYSSEALAIIMTNLISNAIKYTPSGGNVTAVIDYRDDKLFVSISDTGQGISKEHLPKIFDRFYQVDDPGQRAYAGSGIGLALVKELSVLHGGDVSVISPDEEGCIFTFWLESHETEDSENTVAVEQNIVFPVREENPVTNDQRQDTELPLVLVVEDQPELRNFIVQNLGKEYRYAEASNGKDGLALAKELLPDLIISDVMMPDIDGFELCETLKSNVATSHIPIVLLTAKADRKDKLTGLETGADDYITKPFSLAELKLRVKNILNFKELLRKKFEGNTTPSAEETPELNSRDRKFVDDLTQSVENNLSNTQFGINILAEDVFLSVSQMTRKLKTITGKTPADFIRNIRMEKAVELLKNGESVADVSWTVGFEDSVYFSKVFKKHFGFPPSSVKNS